MARRRSLNRCWSRRSGNTMELNPDSELIDEENPAWWRNLEQTTMLRTSGQTSRADVTESILSSDSLVNESEIQDRWWDNLDRTSLHSSKRFSTRRSLNPEEALQDSIASEGTEDTSIKKRKILLRARQRKSGGTETFLRAFDDSDVAQSEPPPGRKRKTQSPAKSEADISRRKMRNRQSRSLADREDASNANTSNDTDVIVKTRPRAFKKKAARLSTDVYDEILTEAGISGANSSEKATAIEAAKAPEKIIDSNESGFAGPTASHRKRLSTISKKLEMSSDESEPGTRKPRLAFRQKARNENASFNPFDEILSGRLNESSASVEAAAIDKSGRSSNAGTRISRSLRTSQTLRASASTIVDAEGAAKEISARESRLRETMGEEQANKETMGNEEKREIPEGHRRSSSGLERNSRVSKRRTEIAGIEETATSEWNVPDTQDDPRISTRRARHSTIIVESMDLDELPESQETNRRSFEGTKEDLRRSKSRTRNATIEETATSESDVPETQEVSRKSVRRTKNSTVIAESVDPDDLPESQKTNRRSSEGTKENPRNSKSRTRNATIEETATSESDVPETQEVSRKSVRRTKNSTVIAESVDPDDLPESQKTNRRSSEGTKENPRNSKSRTRNVTIEETATSESDVPETQEVSRKSVRRTKNSTVVAESVDPDDLPESQEMNRRSSEGTKENPRYSKSRTRNATIEETAMSESDVPETQEVSRKSVRRTKNSTVIAESVDPDDLPESQKMNRRSSEGTKENPRNSKSRTRNATIEETAMSELDVPETQEVSRKSARRTKNSTVIAESVDPDDLPESQKTNRRSSEGTKENPRNSKSRTRNATIEETATSESDVPETQEVSRKSTRRSKDSTTNEESANAEELPEARRRSRRSSSVTKINPRISRRRTRHSTISEATVEDEDLSGFHEKSVKSTTAAKENSKDSMRGAIFKGQNSQPMDPSILVAKSQSQLFQDWGSSGSEMEDVIKTTERSIDVSHNHSLSHKTLELSIPRLTSTKIIDSRQIEDLDENSEKDERREKIHKVKRRSRRSHSRALADSAYELPDKERSGSLIISMSENETPNKNLPPETSTEKSSRKKRESGKSARESVDRSIPDATADKSRKSASRHRDDSGESDNEIDFHEAVKDNEKTTKNHFAKEKSVSRKSVSSTNVFQDENSDQSISEELAIGSWNSNLSRRSSRLERKTDEFGRATGSRLSGRSDENIGEEEENHTQEMNLNLSRRSSRLEKRSATPTDASRPKENFSERISDVELELDEASEARKISPPIDDRANTSRKSSKRRNVSEKRVESDVSVEESNSRDKRASGRKSSVRPNVSRRRLESDESVSESEANSKSPNQSKPKNKSRAGGKMSVSRQRIESDESNMEEDAENLENTNPDLGNRSNQPPIDASRPQNTTNRNKSSFAAVENIHGESSTTIPSEPIPVAPALTKLPQNTRSFLGTSKANATGAQKNITDFFQSKFLQKTDASRTLESFASFDKEKLERVQREVERKRQELAATRIREAAKRKQIPATKRPENFLKAKKLRTNNENTRKEAAKAPKVVDKAYIVNGQVYKRPRLPRPKPWVTDRLYRHLWKKMEPKYELRTRVKSENFVEQLSGVVALTIRRKKYESYKPEVDALMKEMARLNIIKTRNDFYDFCYDYLPYDFRVKVTPMLLPGNVRNIPYDPATLHTPILSESR